MEHLSDPRGGNFAGDILSRAKNFLSPALTWSKTSTKTLKQYSKYPIVNLQIYRTPLAKFLGAVINAISLGAWNQGMRTYGFDKFYHLALVATVKTKTGLKNIIIEKNEVVNISTSYKTKADTEVFSFGEGHYVSLGVFLDRGRQKAGAEKFFLYDPFYNNCQSFIRLLLEANGLYSFKAKQFLYQDISSLVKKLPRYLHPIAKGTTNLGSVVSKLTGGNNDPIVQAKFKKMILDLRNS